VTRTAGGTPAVRASLKEGANREVHAVGIVFPVPLAASWLAAALYGALFGFVVYAAYDLTNLATLRGWPMAVSLVDLAWGVAVSAAACIAAFVAVRALS